MNEKCKSILEFLRSGAMDTFPSVREICAATGIRSTSCVHRYLGILEDEGYIERVNSGARGYRLSGGEGRLVPLMGTVTAGKPILAVEDVSEMLTVPFKHLSGELFALRVKGESMKNAAILDGDIIVARRTPAADDGDIVVALIEDEATVKRLYHEPDGRIRLQPENDAFEPIFPEVCIILGVVCAVMREL